MKRYFFLVLLFWLSYMSKAQNVGIGTNNPTEKLDVNGAIKIAGTNNALPNAGTIRWNLDKNDFEGYNGKSWISLTGGKSEWGNQSSYSYETEATNIFNTSNTSQFATSLSGYGDWLVAGDGMQNVGNAIEAGAFRLFKKENGEWVQKQNVTATDYNTEMNFGLSVAMNANYILSGAPGTIVNGTKHGKIYVYGLSNSANYSTTLIASDGAENDLFGYSVAIENNFIVAGAPGNNVGIATDQGSVYVFQLNAGTWQQVANLTNPSGSFNEYLGSSVSIYGNYIVAGAPEASANGQQAAGKVCVYQYNGSSWSFLTTLTSPSVAPNQYFGSSVFLSHDTLIVGSSENRHNIGGKGKVFVYVRTGSSWNLQATIVAPDGKNDDGFGTSVHFNDGYLIVGAPKAWVGGVRKGKSYIYKPLPQGWLLQSNLTSSDGATNDEFGNVVLINNRTAFCSAPYASQYQNDHTGRIYFFSH